MRHARYWVVFAAIALIGIGSIPDGGAQLKIALEDKLDTNPRQVALTTEIAGMCVGFVISWTDRLRRQGN